MNATLTAVGLIATVNTVAVSLTHWTYNDTLAVVTAKLTSRALCQHIHASHITQNVLIIYSKRNIFQFSYVCCSLEVRRWRWQRGNESPSRRSALVKVWVSVFSRNLWGEFSPPKCRVFPNNISSSLLWTPSLPTFDCELVSYTKQHHSASPNAQ